MLLRGLGPQSGYYHHPCICMCVLPDKHTYIATCSSFPQSSSPVFPPVRGAWPELLSLQDTPDSPEMNSMSLHFDHWYYWLLRYSFLMSLGRDWFCLRTAQIKLLFLNCPADCVHTTYWTEPLCGDTDVECFWLFLPTHRPMHRGSSSSEASMKSCVSYLIPIEECGAPNQIQIQTWVLLNKELDWNTASRLDPYVRH